MERRVRLMDKYTGQYKRRVNSNAKYDGYKRLAAAVIAKACSDLKNPTANYCDSPAVREEKKRKKRHSAKQFLEGDMQPYANILGITESYALKEWLKENGLQRRSKNNPSV